jgi:hypothetical protein
MFELDERAETAGSRIALQTQIADLVARHNNQSLHKKNTGKFMEQAGVMFVAG